MIMRKEVTIYTPTLEIILNLPALVHLIKKLLKRFVKKAFMKINTQVGSKNYQAFSNQRRERSLELGRRMFCT